MLDGRTVQAPCTESSGDEPMTSEPVNLSGVSKDILRITQEGLGGTYVWGALFNTLNFSRYVEWVYRPASTFRL